MTHSSPTRLPADLTPDTLHVVFSRVSASVPNCPGFNREVNHEFQDSMTSNFGCAVNSNLAAMVARPQDLVHGQPYAPSVDPATATKAIQTFRAAKPTGAGGLQSETTGGK